MGKITYGIKLAKSSPFAEEIKGRKRKLKQYTQENNEKLAGRVLLDLADLYLNQAEYIDPEDPTSTQGYYRQQDLEECLNYCKKAIKVFKKKKLYRYLARTYIIMIQCYHKIPDFDNGILINVQLLDLFRTSKSNLKDNSLYQQAYKLLADAYFTHGHSDNRKFKDFKYAEQFYEKERKIILKMTADNVGGDQLLLKDIKRSSNFNIGVIKSKLSYEIQDISEPIKYLMDAIEDAKQLKDYDSERKTWWELGNLYSGRGKWELTLDCRLKELELTKKYQLGDQLAVMIEVAKIYIMMESYSACMELCRDMRSWANSTYSNERKNEDDGYDLQSANDMIQAVVDMVHKMRDQRRRFKQLINNYDTIESAKRCDGLDKNNDNNSNNIHGVDHKKLCLQIVEECLSLSELFGELELAKPALDIIDTGLKYCKLIEKQDQMGEDYLLYVLEIELLETKANIYMTWFFTSLTMLEDLNQQIVENAKKYIKDEIKQMDIMIDAFERFTQIYYYFDDGDLYEKWMKITKDTKIRYNSIVTDDDMDIDHENEDNTKKNTIDSHSPLKNEVHNTLNTAVKNSVLVSLKLKERKIYILVPIDSLEKTLEWLAGEVSKLIWERYSVEPNINYFTLDGKNLPADMNLNSLLMKPIKNLEANVVGYLERSPLEVYENICDRLKTKKNTKIIKALAEETLSSALDLRGTDLKTDDIDTLIRFLNTITLPLNQIDLSANLLKDDDVIKLFDAIICPAKIILSSNLITLKSFDYFYEHHEDKLESIELSYTMIQSITQKQISDFYNKHPKLKHFNIDGCEIINE